MQEKHNMETEIEIQATPEEGLTKITTGNTKPKPHKQKHDNHSISKL